MAGPVLLLQPRHAYAPPASAGAIGHVYMPTALLSVAARLIDAGVEVHVIDENLDSPGAIPRVVGINLVGAPYIAPVIDRIREISRSEPETTFLLGGRVVNGLTLDQFASLFGTLARNGNNDDTLLGALDLDSSRLHPAEETSLVSAYEQLPDDVMRLYLQREFCFYLSQGCKYACTFCAATRSRRGDVVRERYRTMASIDRDLRYLTSRAAALGVEELRLYLSNLDLFQTPEELRHFAGILETLGGPTRLRLRGLATVASFNHITFSAPEVLRRLVDCGLERVGYGIDGATPLVWRSVNKPQTVEQCLAAIQRSKEEYGITPEALMVFGHSGIDTLETLESAYAFGVAMQEQYGAVPRPHVAKSIVPGNDGWLSPEGAQVVEYLLRRPTGFQMLDFTALPSWLTHPRDDLRQQIAEAFVRMCSLPECLTSYVEPEDPELDEVELERRRAFNRGRYDV